MLVSCTRRQLEVLRAAAEDCHFQVTAARLGISASAVSCHIATLESQLGLRIFSRKSGRKPVLTPGGRDLIGAIAGSGTGFCAINSEFGKGP